MWTSQITKVTYNGPDYDKISDVVETKVRETIDKMVNDMFITISTDSDRDCSTISYTNLSEKNKFKAKLKSNYYTYKKLKFKRGDLYVIKAKNVPGLRFDKRIYKCIQVVWSIEDNIDISSVVMKQIAGPNMSPVFLTELDCRNLHVKYEPGLQIMSMYLNWVKYKK